MPLLLGIEENETRADDSDFEPGPDARRDACRQNVAVCGEKAGVNELCRAILRSSVGHLAIPGLAR